MSENLGSYINALRRDGKKTQEELARMASVSQPFISNVEAGVKIPSESVLNRIITKLQGDAKKAAFLLLNEKPQKRRMQDRALVVKVRNDSNLQKIVDKWGEISIEKKEEIVRILSGIES
jgi:predicted transcriptional regulator